VRYVFLISLTLDTIYTCSRMLMLREEMIARYFLGGERINLLATAHKVSLFI